MPLPPTCPVLLVRTIPTRPRVFGWTHRRSVRREVLMALDEIPRWRVTNDSVTRRKQEVLVSPRDMVKGIPNFTGAMVACRLPRRWQPPIFRTMPIERSRITSIDTNTKVTVTI